MAVTFFQKERILSVPSHQEFPAQKNTQGLPQSLPGQTPGYGQA